MGDSVNAIFGPYAEEPLIPFMEAEVIPFGVCNLDPKSGREVEEFNGLPKDVCGRRVSGPKGGRGKREEYFRPDGAAYDEVAARIAEHKGLSSYDATTLIVDTFTEYYDLKALDTKEGRDAELDVYYQHELDKANVRKKKMRKAPQSHYERARKPLDVRQAAAVGKIPDPMQYAAVLIMYRAGLRVSEMLSLQWRDVAQYPNGDENVTVLQVRDSKTETGEGRRVPVNGEITEALTVLLKQAKREGTVKLTDRIIPRTRQTVYRWCRAAGDNGTHACRHSYITDHAAAGTSVFTIMALVGHKNVSTTQKYVHTTLGTMADAVSKLGRG